MILKQVLENIPDVEILSGENTKISGLSTDSRYVEPGDLFLALVGKKTNGYRFLAQVLEKGAAAVAGDEIKTKKAGIACVHFPGVSQYVAAIASKVYNHPSRNFSVVGVTGTSGKTTTAYLIEAMLRGIYGDAVGYIGSVETRWLKSHQESKYSTPPAPQLQRILRKMAEAEVRSVVIECSSHGLAQGRLDHTQMNVGVFTNLTPDHLDYHKDFVVYRNAKWKLFSSVLSTSEKSNKVAVFNADDPTGRSWAKERIPQTVNITYSTEKTSKADVIAESYELENDCTKTVIRVGGKKYPVKIPLIGSINLSNFLAAVSAIHALGLNVGQGLSVFSKPFFIPGRLEKVSGTGEIEVFVDYAHTPDTLRSCLEILGRWKRGRIITVIGAGGGGDTERRPKLGEAAIEGSDIVIVTSDNPRNDDPDEIIDQIVSGIDVHQYPQKKVEKFTLREEGIARALELAKPKDIVLIAGKGHELFQEILGLRRPFEDRKVVKNWFKQK